MRKIILSFLSILCIGFCLLGLSSCDNSKYEIEIEGYTLQIEENGEYSIIEIPTEILNQTVWSVPEKIGEYPISRLGSYLRERAFMAAPYTSTSLGNIKRIYIPECIKSICLTSLSNVAVWETEAAISQIDFQNAFPHETEVCFLSPVEENENNRRYITEENIVNDNMVICANEEGTEATLVVAFGEGTLEIPDTFNDLPVTSIGERAVYEEGFDSVVLGENIKSIGKLAFARSSVTQIEFIEGIISLKTECFLGTKLKSVTLPSTVRTLESGVFYASDIESFDLSNIEVFDLPASMFRGCPLTGELKFSENLYGIGEYAFYGSDLTEIVLPESLTRLGNNSFGNCRNLKSLRLPDGVFHFHASVVSGCDALESLHLNMIERYSVEANDTKALKEITVSEDNEKMSVENGILYSKDKSVLYRCPTKLQIESITIDSKTVEGGAFFGNEFLKNVSFTENNTEIKANAFEDCTSLESVQLSSKVTTIEFAAFRDCSSLKTINTENVEYFKLCCFARCTSLQNVDLSSSKEIGEQAFCLCDLREVKLGYGCKVGRSAFEGNVNLKSFDSNGGTLEDTNALYNTPLYDDGEEEKNGWEKFWDFLCSIFPVLYSIK